MTKEWNVLSVDDDQQKQDELERVLSSRMGDHKLVFSKTNSFDKGIEIINSARLDLVILDVHEDKTDPDPSENPMQEDQRGEELLSVIKKSRFLPVIFYTGYPAKVKHLENPYVKVIDKGAPPDEIRKSVLSIFSTGLLDLSRHVEEQSRIYMWESLEGSLKDQSLKKPTDLTLLLARNMSKNLAQDVVKNIISEELDVINPLEMYLYPPEPNRCNPADILKKNDGTYWMVLTPACDFEQSKVDNVLMVKLTPLTQMEEYKGWLEEYTKFKELPASEQTRKNKKGFNEKKDFVRKIVQGRAAKRFKYLPGTFFMEDMVADFQETGIYSIEDESFEIVCNMDSPFREEVLHHFSNYYGRIGTPDYDSEYLWSQIESEVL